MHSKQNPTETSFRPAAWRDSWLARNWLDEMPLLRFVVPRSRKRSLSTLGGDLLMVLGMVTGMVLAHKGIHLLGRARPGGDGMEAATFGVLIGSVPAIAMVLGMAAGMICWMQCARALHLEEDGPAPPSVGNVRSWRASPFVQQVLSFVPGLRAVCQPTVSSACLTLCADAFAISGMLLGMAVVHELAMDSTVPVHGLLTVGLLGLGMALGMGVGGGLWNTIRSVASTIRE